MPRAIVDERTLAGYLIGPTEQRAREIALGDGAALILFADVEEHVVDSGSRATLRCDLTLRSRRRPLVSVEMKRPEVMGVTDPVLVADAYRKAMNRGMSLFLTSDIGQVAVWDTRLGPRQTDPQSLHELAPGLTHSYYAQARRQEIGDNWRAFLDILEPSLLTSERSAANDPLPLPPQAIELREAIKAASQEAAERIREAVSNDVFHTTVLTEFRSQFGVELHLDPQGSVDAFIAESEQVATIAGFVVAMRLLLFQALSSAVRTDGTSFGLDPLDIARSSTDPARVANDLKGLLDHAKDKTGDFETTLTPNVLDDILFVPAGRGTDVGERWGAVIDVIKGATWSGPAAYVPGLYESLLDDEHRHVMGVHYTPDGVAEVVAAYAVRGGADVVMDPAAGAGTFITMAYERKRALGSTHEQSLAETYGVEIADFAASLSTISLTLADPDARSAYPRVVQSDFFRTMPGGPTRLVLPQVGTVAMPRGVDAIVGNPPYIRFENRTPAERREVYDLLARRYLDREMAYPDFTGKADLWAFFVAHAYSYLIDGGRLAFVLPLSLVATTYGDAVLSFLGRHFLVDAIIDSKVERWFAAKQNTLLLLARRAPTPPDHLSATDNPNIPSDHQVRFVRFKQPLQHLLDAGQNRGKRAEDLIYEVMGTNVDVSEDLRWDIRLVAQEFLTARVRTQDADDDGDADGEATDADT